MRRYLAAAPVLLGLSVFGVPAAQAAPSAVTGIATGAGTTGVTLNGTVDPGGVDTAWFFELAPVSATDKLDTDLKVLAGSGAQPVSVAVSGLAPGTTYTYSLVAIDANGVESDGTSGTFSTTAVAPLVTGVTQVTGTSALLSGVLPGGSASFISYRLVMGATIASADATFSTGGSALVATPGLAALPADGVDDASALLHASFPPGQDGTFQFEYGTTSSYGVLTEPLPLTPDMTAAVAGVAALLPSQTYHYRLLLSTSQGVLVSGDMSFTTLGDTMRPSVAVSHSSCKAGRACTLGGSASDDALADVKVRVVLKTGKTCRAFTGKVFVKRSCAAASKTFVEAWTARGKWMLQLPALKAGTYQVTARATDRAGNTKDASTSVKVKG